MLLTILLLLVASLLLLRSRTARSQSIRPAELSGAVATESADQTADLVGTWRYDGQTQYRFDASGNGAMIIDGAEYAFRYAISDDALTLDFTDEMFLDATYRFDVSGDALTLAGQEGTVGGEYNLTRAD